jgi:hypothetical protein
MLPTLPLIEIDTVPSRLSELVALKPLVPNVRAGTWYPRKSVVPVFTVLLSINPEYGSIVID